MNKNEKRLQYYVRKLWSLQDEERIEILDEVIEKIIKSDIDNFVDIKDVIPGEERRKIELPNIEDFTSLNLKNDKIHDIIKERIREEKINE